MDRELTDQIHSEVTRLSAEGDSLADAGDYLSAVQQFEIAVALLPAPVEKWTAATWLFTAIGDCYFLADDFESARVALNRAQLCPDSLDNPFIWLRRGQVYYELGDTRLADDCLASAYTLGGTEVFAREDPKYAHYILAKLQPPETPNKGRQGTAAPSPAP